MANKLLEDTIAAIATPFGLAGVGIIRISGPQAKAVGDRIFQPKRKIKLFESHKLYLGHLIDPSSGQMIDEVLLSYMRSPHSYTKEDVIEINSHSGPVLLSRILEIVLEQGARLAEPGEFTFRAFSNGRIDLTQAEAIVDLINSRSNRGLELATRQIKGELKTEIEKLRQKVIELLARAEVAIDFPDEEAEIFSREDMSLSLNEELVKPIGEIISMSDRRRIWVDGINTVIAGKVNVGKSSLLNRLLNEQRSIVTPIPGTTRDVIESIIHINGIPLRLMDTAGIREVWDEVEKIGIQLAEKKLSEADLLLILVDQSRLLDQIDFDIIERSKSTLSIIIVNKIDLPKKINEEQLKRASKNNPVLRISAQTGEGIDLLMTAIKDRIIGDDSDAVYPTLAPNLRHRKALEDACRFFKKAAVNSKNMAPMEIITEDLNSGLEAIGEIIGETGNDEIYEKIFSEFCLGK